MARSLRKLCLIPALAIVLAALASAPVSAGPGDEGCPYEHHQCPEPFYDCCCNRGVACTNNEYECWQFCGWV
jgi:hypothetical protein